MLRDDMERYLKLRKTTGFKLVNETLLLDSFVKFAEHFGDRHIHTDRVLAWASQTRSTAQGNRRLSSVRHLAQSLQAEDPRHEVPHRDALGNARHRRPPPYIFSQEEIAKLIELAGRLEPANSIRPLMLSTLFGLLAATGLRISEALALRLSDMTDDGLLILETKFHKSRLVPLHPSSIAAIEKYLAAREAIATDTDALFIGLTGKPPKYDGLRGVFSMLMEKMGLQHVRNGGHPHIHDLRHTFAVRSLELCHGDRNAVSRHMTALSTYLGHTRVTNTYWYLQATPVLLGQVAESAEMFYREGAQ